MHPEYVRPDRFNIPTMKRVTYRGQEGRTSAAITIDGVTLPKDKEVEVSDEIAGRLSAQEKYGHKFDVKDSSSGSKSTDGKKSSGGASKVSNR